MSNEIESLVDLKHATYDKLVSAHVFTVDHLAQLTGNQLQDLGLDHDEVENVRHALKQTKHRERVKEIVESSEFLDFASDKQGNFTWRELVDITVQIYEKKFGLGKNI